MAAWDDAASRELSALILQAHCGEEAEVRGAVMKEIIRVSCADGLPSPALPHASRIASQLSSLFISRGQCNECLPK